MFFSCQQLKSVLKYRHYLGMQAGPPLDTT